LRWRFTADTTVSGVGWYVDTVAVGSGYACCVDPSSPTHFTWDAIPSPQCVNLPFNVTIRARNDASGIATNFTGVMALTGTGDSSFLVPISPPVSGNFMQGVWTGSVTVPQTVSNLLLHADDGLRPVALANPIQVVDAPAVETERYGDILLFLWPLWPAGAPTFTLHTSTNLEPFSWVPVPQPPLQLDGSYVLPVYISDPHRYYRLKSSTP
jgi:hypothetical protein